MTKVIKMTKSEILERFAKMHSNADKMLVDYGRDVLTICFGGIEKHYSIKKVIETMTTHAKNKGITLEVKQ